MFATICPLLGAYGSTVNDCMPFTSPIPLEIRRASWLTWVLLPRITPPLSQYRKRTSWSPSSFAWATICSGVMGVPRCGKRGVTIRGGGLAWLGRGDLLGHDLGAERELAALHG